MLSKLFPALLCGLSLAAQTPSALQDSLKTARTASQAGDVEAALTQYKSAFDLASGLDASLIPGIAVEIAALLETAQSPSDTEAFLLKAAELSETKGLPALAEVPLANRLSMRCACRSALRGKTQKPDRLLRKVSRFCATRTARMLFACLRCLMPLPW